MSRWLLLLYVSAFLGLSVSVTGCGERQNGVRVEGQVTFNGKPLEQGIINFTPTDGQGQTAAARVEQGAYSLVIAPGPKAVSIISEAVVGQQKVYPDDPNSQVSDIVEQVIPAIYNNESELTAEVSPDNRNFDFNLTNE